MNPNQITDVVGTLATNSGPNSHDAGNFSSNQGVDAGHIVVMSSGQANAEITADLSPALNCNRDGAPIAFSGQMSTPQVDFDMSSTLDQAQGQAIAFTQNQRDEVRTMEPGMKQQTYVATHDVAGTMKSCANSGGFSNSADHAAAGYMQVHGMAVRRLTPVECSRLQQFPDDYLELKYANANEAHAAQILHELWREIGAKGIAAQEANFPQDGSGDVCEKRRIATALFTPEVLLAGVHVGWIQWDQARRSAEHQNITHVGAAGWTDGFVRRLREAGEAGCPPYRRESYQQCASELGYFVQELPLETAQIRAYLQRSELWQEAQGAWTLRYAFATPKEIESGKPLMSDGPRYKALGNSMAVPCMVWLGKRIQMVEDLCI